MSDTLIFDGTSETTEPTLKLRWHHGVLQQLWLYRLTNSKNIAVGVRTEWHDVPTEDDDG